SESRAPCRRASAASALAWRSAAALSRRTVVESGSTPTAQVAVRGSRSACPLPESFLDVRNRPALAHGYPREVSTSLRIREMLVTPVACPDPPLLNHHGVHEPVFLRAIIRLRTEDGLEGLGEGPGGGLYVQQLRSAARHVIGADAFHLEALRVLIDNPRVFSTIEVPLLDLIGKAAGRSVTDLLGGPARRRVPFSAYLFYKEEGQDDWGRALTPEELVKQAQRFHDDYGMTVFK